MNKADVGSDQCGLVGYAYTMNVGRGGNKNKHLQSENQ